MLKMTRGLKASSDCRLPTTVCVLMTYESTLQESPCRPTGSLFPERYAAKTKGCPPTLVSVQLQTVTSLRNTWPLTRQMKCFPNGQTDRRTDSWRGVTQKNNVLTQDRNSLNLQNNFLPTFCWSWNLLRRNKHVWFAALMQNRIWKVDFTSRESCSWS